MSLWRTRVRERGGSGDPPPHALPFSLWGRASWPVPFSKQVEESTPMGIMPAVPCDFAEGTVDALGRIPYALFRTRGDP